MVTWRIKSDWTPTDPDAAAYIAAVETADGQALEEKVKIAIDNFVLGCKQDGIWSAIKAGCILAGARTLDGSLVPLVGTAPTNFNFVSGDYNRETGLVGDGSTKRLDSNRNNNADPQDSQHLAVYVSTAATSTSGTYPIYLGADDIASGGASHIGRMNNNGDLYFRSRQTGINFNITKPGNATGFVGMSRSVSTTYNVRRSAATVVPTVAGGNMISSTPFNGSIFVYGSTANYQSNARLAFYSIGESLDLAALDGRVTDLMTAIGAAIP